MVKYKSQDPLQGITLKMMLDSLIAHYGWEAMGAQVNIRCFNHDPSVGSSLAFLRKTPWARQKVEKLYLKMVNAGAKRNISCKKI